MSGERVLRGYDHVPGATCPYCGGSHMAIVDDGAAETVAVKCWCGASARCARDDADLVALLAEPVWVDGRLVDPAHPEICVHHVGVSPGLWCGACREGP